MDGSMKNQFVENKRKMIRKFCLHASLDSKVELSTATADTLDAGNVLPALHVAKAVRDQEFAHCRRLVVAMLHQQPAIGCKMVRGAVDDVAKRRQAVCVIG